jgi:transcriptional regulator with XRE-family HTH domain
MQVDASPANTTRSSVGDLLRAWRGKRGMSQMALALAAGVSPRHLSFVETGKSNPSAELVMALTRCLDLNLRDRNALMLAAGYAPRFRETALAAREMDSVRGAVEHLLGAHDPYPGIALDRHWNVVQHNRAAARLLALLPPSLASPPINMFRASLHPDGLAAMTDNFDAWGRYLVQTLGHLVAGSLDPELAALRDDVLAYPNVRALVEASAGAPSAQPGDALLLACVMRVHGQRLSFFTTLVALTTPLDVTLSELKIELFYPADTATAQALRETARLP